ncbi:MAG: sensor histidine kinase [Pseudomonadales bacterium]
MPQQTANRRINQTGIVILAALLLAAAAILLLGDRFSLSERSQDQQHRAVALSQVLMGQLDLDSGRRPAMSLFEFQLQDPAFAYGALYGADGALISALPGNLSPAPLTVRDPSSWLAPQPGQDADGSALQVYAGLDRSGRQYQFAMRAPQSRFGLAQVPQMALLCLPLLLLGGLFLLLLRRDVRPISKLSHMLDRFEQDKQLGELRTDLLGSNDAFLNRFGGFVEYVQGRLDNSNSVSSKLISNERLANYRMARLESVLQALPDGLIWLDENARVLTANRRALQILGLAEDEYKLLPLRDFSAQPKLREFFTRIEQRGARHIEAVELELPAPAPGCLLLSAHAVSQPSAAATLIGAVILMRDATSESLAKRSRSEFIANVAHELKSPLNTLRLYADSLVDDGDDPEIRLEATQVMQDEVDRLAGLINNLLNITQIETGSLQIQNQRTHLQTMLQDIVDTMSRSEAAKALKVTLQVPGDIPAVSVDKELLRIAINNLLSNAIKYSDPGDHVSVAVSDSAEAISISVTDSGIGIDAQEQERIFDKFYRAPDPDAVRRGGHGLGLALSKEIVQLHHGSLRLESMPGEGSTFTIDLYKSSGVVQEAIA